LSGAIKYKCPDSVSKSVHRVADFLQIILTLNARFDIISKAIRMGICVLRQNEFKCFITDKNERSDEI